MSLPSSGEEFWLRFSPKVRKNRRWQAKKLLNDHSGKVRIDCFTKTSEFERMIQEVEQVAKKTYQRGLGVGFVDSEDVRERLSLKAEKGWLRTYVLYVADLPCAFWSGTLYHREFHSDFMGYDPDYGKYSPGMYLIIHVIEDFCKRSGEGEVAAIDFGLGDAQYKEILGNLTWQDVSFYVFAPTPRGIALNALRTPIKFLDQWSKNLLARTKLLQKVKRTWRHQVTGG
jgi:CelD/BcsL family acetyltransferase involved in cellulose biosynthesis